MPSLNQITDEIADALNRPFDDMLKLRLKEIIKNERALLIREQQSKYGVDDVFIQRYVADVEKVDKSEYPNVSECTILRTQNKIPAPVRMNRDTPFSYVGTIDGNNAFRKGDFSHTKFMHFLSLSGGGTTYSYRDGYVFIFSRNKLKQITITAAYDSPELVIPTETSSNISNGITYSDDMEFPLSRDLIQRIKEKLLSGELAITDGKDKHPADHLDNN